MQHIIYIEGNTKMISWVIQTGKDKVEQSRLHPEIYLDKVTESQSKYIALHVGLFWGIGTFSIKDNEEMTVRLDDKQMYERLTTNEKKSDEFIEKRIGFIRHLISQRNLKIQYEIISEKENLAKKLQNTGH